MKKGLVKKGQIWREKNTGRLLKITTKASGNFHWSAVQLNGNQCHHIHEGTLQKYYDLIKN